jgi:hypothetical protein
MDSIALAIQRTLPQDTCQLVLRGFGLDIAVFTRNFGSSCACFFEIKAFAEHHGRCGFGNGRGEGNQIRLLFGPESQAQRGQSQIEMLGATVRWVLGNRSQPVGSARYLFFTSMQAQQAAMGGVRPGKQNNLNLSRFKAEWITWPELIEGIIAFISGPPK